MTFPSAQAELNTQWPAGSLAHQMQSAVLGLIAAAVDNDGGGAYGAAIEINRSLREVEFIRASRDVLTKSVEALREEVRDLTQEAAEVAAAHETSKEEWEANEAALRDTAGEQDAEIERLGDLLGEAQALVTQAQGALEEALADAQAAAKAASAKGSNALGGMVALLGPGHLPSRLAPAPAPAPAPASAPAPAPAPAPKYSNPGLGVFNVSGLADAARASQSPNGGSGKGLSAPSSRLSSSALYDTPAQGPARVPPAPPTFASAPAPAPVAAPVLTTDPTKGMSVAEVKEWAVTAPIGEVRVAAQADSRSTAKKACEERLATADHEHKPGWVLVSLPGRGKTEGTAYHAIMACMDLAVLLSARNIEENCPVFGRKTILRALGKRILELKAA